MEANDKTGTAGIIFSVFIASIGLAGLGAAGYFGSRAFMVSSIMGSITLRNWIAANTSEFSSLSSQLLSRGLSRLTYKELIGAYGAKSNPDKLRQYIKTAVAKLKMSVVINARGGGYIYYTVRESGKDVFSGQVSEKNPGTVANLKPLDVSVVVAGNGINSSVSIT